MRVTLLADMRVEYDVFVLDKASLYRLLYWFLCHCHLQTRKTANDVVGSSLAKLEPIGST